MGAVELELDPEQFASLTAVSAPPADDYPYGAAGAAQRHRAIGATDS